MIKYKIQSPKSIKVFQRARGKESGVWTKGSRRCSTCGVLNRSGLLSSGARQHFATGLEWSISSANLCCLLRWNLAQRSSRGVIWKVLESDSGELGLRPESEQLYVEVTSLYFPFYCMENIYTNEWINMAFRGSYWKWPNRRKKK